jgi:iron only hydrogenase large subunit-like protein
LRNGENLIFQIVPAVYFIVGKVFSDKIGTLYAGKIISGVRKMRFRYVFEIIVGANMTIYEEANGLHKNIQKIDVC